MREKIPKVIFWVISLILFGEFIYYVRGINAQNFINVLLLLLLVIITNPYIVDKISKKVGQKKQTICTHVKCCLYLVAF